VKPPYRSWTDLLACLAPSSRWFGRRAARRRAREKSRGRRRYRWPVEHPLHYESLERRVLLTITTVQVQPLFPFAYETSGQGPMSAQFEVYRASDDFSQALTVSFTENGSAVANVDYTAASSVTIPAGATSVAVMINPLDDGAADDLNSGETLNVQLTAGTGYTLGANTQTTITIFEQVPGGPGGGGGGGATPMVGIYAMMPDADEEQAQPGQFEVTRMPGSSTAQPLTVSLSLGGTAANGTDYSTIGPSVTIPAGAQQVTVAVTPIDDQNLLDPNKTVIASIVPQPGVYQVGSSSSATVTILDYDAPTVTVVATQPNANEETATAGTFTVTRSGMPSASPLTVSYTVAGTAVAGADYTPLSGSVTIPANSSTATITVAPLDDGAIYPYRQSIVVPPAQGGTYTLTLGPDTTSPLAYNANAAAVQTALAALANVGAGNVQVNGSGTAIDPLMVTFLGPLANATLPQLAADGTNLIGAATVSVTTAEEGASPANNAQRVGFSTQGAQTNGGNLVDGTFTLTVNGQTTAALSIWAGAADVQTAMEALSGVGAGNVDVQALDTGTQTRSFVVSFIGTLGNQNVPQVTVGLTATQSIPSEPGPFTIATTLVAGNSTGTDAVQTISLAGGAAGGTFTLSYGGQTSAPIAADASAATVVGSKKPEWGKEAVHERGCRARDGRRKERGPRGARGEIVAIQGREASFSLTARRTTVRADDWNAPRPSLTPLAACSGGAVRPARESKSHRLSRAARPRAGSASCNRATCAFENHDSR